MTSSLVGSEMCIRDRHNTPAQNALLDHTSRPGNGSWLYINVPEDKPPVSYTHLTLPTICSV
eukprot:826484-Prorocentrum_lima.AAC.1